MLIWSSRTIRPASASQPQGMPRRRPALSPPPLPPQPCFSPCIAGRLCAGAGFAIAIQVADAAPADFRVRRIGADILAHVPAALAFGVGERRAEDFFIGLAHQRRLRADENEAQILAQRSQKVVFLAIGMQRDLGLQRRADLAGDAQVFQGLGDVGAVSAELAPFVEQRGLAVNGRQRPPGMQHDRILGAAADDLPDFLGGEGEDRRHQLDEAARDVPQRVLCRAARLRVGGGGVEAILEDVEVKTAQVFRTESLQRLHDAVEFVPAVILFALRLQAARHGQYVAVDFQPTTMVRKEVADEMINYLTIEYGNPSSLYNFGYNVAKKIDESRKVIAKYIGANSDEIFFNSCATEGNNNAILSAVSSIKGKNIVTTKIEHSSVFNVYKTLKDKKDLRFINLNEYGYVDLTHLENIVDENTEIVTIAYVHNELGTIQEIDKIGEIIKKKNKKTIFHVDCAQAFGKLPIDVKKSKIDILTLSGHKLHAPKGIGVIYINKAIKLKPLLIGGGQEKSFRSGTENVSGIMGLKVATEFMYENLQARNEHIKKLRNKLICGISEIENHKIISPKDGISNILLVAFENIKSEVVLHFLESDNIYISTGSACSKGKKSRTFEAINLNDRYSDGVIRISLSEYNTEDEIDIFLSKLKKYIEEVRNIVNRGR